MRPYYTLRWYPPAGWSQKAIDRELVKVAVAFEQKVKAGETVFMPSLAIRCSENTRTGYQGNLNKWIYPVLGDFKLPEVTAAQIPALWSPIPTGLLHPYVEQLAFSPFFL